MKIKIPTLIIKYRAAFPYSPIFSAAYESSSAEFLIIMHLMDCYWRTMHA